MMNRNVILFSGVHGVGKGFFISKNIKVMDPVICIGASTLIRQYQNSEDAGYKKVKNVWENQETLLKALQHVKISSDKVLLLDGHLCIINSNTEIERIPVSFLLRAKIKGIIFLQEKSPLIVKRQQLRDGKCLSNEIVDRIQYEERVFSEMLFEKYQIPFEVISGTCQRDDFLGIIHGMMEGNL